MQIVMLFQNRLRICLPEDFSPVLESEAAEIYPSSERPQVIFSSANFLTFLTFSLLDKPLGSEETLHAAREMKKLIWSLYPGSILSDIAPLRFGNLRSAGFSFRTGVKEAQVFNTMFVVSFEDRLLLGTYGCRMDDDEGKRALRRSLAEAEHLKLRHEGFDALVYSNGVM